MEERRRVTVRYLSHENDDQVAAQQAQQIQDLCETRYEPVVELPIVMIDDGQNDRIWLDAAPVWSLENTTWRGAVIHRSSDGIGFSDFRAITASADAEASLADFARC